MSKLKSFSIETDQEVVLTFADGRAVTARVRQLANILEPDDLARVRAAFKLRRDFFKRYMPKLVPFAIAAQLLAASIIPHHANAMSLLSQNSSLLLHLV